MFNFKAFLSALLVGIPWIFTGEWKRFAGTFLIMVSGIILFFVADPNMEKAAERPALVLVFLSAPAFLMGFYFAEKTPRNLFLRGLTIMGGGLVSWFVVGNLVSYGLESGIIPAWEIEYEAPLTGQLAGNVDGHKRLSLKTAQRCKVEHDELVAQHRQYEVDLDAMKPRGEAGLTEKVRLDREKRAIEETRSRNLTSSQNDALNARIRRYNRDANAWNAENKAYFAEQDRLIQAISDSMLPPDEWYQRCTVKTAIHYDNYRQVCTLRDFGLFSGGNLFCKNFPRHKRHMEEQIANQRKARNAR